MKYALIVFFVFLSVLPAYAEKIAIAVLELDAKGEGLSQGVADALTETVRYEFAKQESIDLVAREKMKELAKEKAFQLTGCTDVACAVQIGKALNVQKMVMGSVTKLGFSHTLYLQLVDVEKENVECNEKVEAGSMQDSLSGYIPNLVYKLFSCIERQKAKRIVLKYPSSAKAHFDFGLVLYSQGWMIDRAFLWEAEREYREAIRLKPDYTEAHFILGTCLRDREQYL